MLQFSTNINYRVFFTLALVFAVIGCSEQSIVDFERTIPSPIVLVKDGLQNFQPSWHPDCEQIVYVAQSTGSAVRGAQIRMVAIATKERRTLFTDSTAAMFPRFSPDGKRLLFISHRSGSGDIWCYRTANGSFYRLTNLPGDESFPCWSPDGAKIAFLTQGRIAFTDTLGSPPTYAPNLPYTVWSLCWGEDGNSLIFSAFRDDFIRDQLFRYLIEEKRFVDISPDGIFGNWPASAVHRKNHLGAYIAFQNFADPSGGGVFGGGISLYRLATDTVTPIVASGFSPAWSPDGLQLTYASDGKIMLETIWVMMDD